MLASTRINFLFLSYVSVRSLDLVLMRTYSTVGPISGEYNFGIPSTPDIREDLVRTVQSMGPWEVVAVMELYCQNSVHRNRTVEIRWYRNNC